MTTCRILKWLSVGDYLVYQRHTLLAAVSLKRFLPFLILHCQVLERRHHLNLHLLPLLTRRLQVSMEAPTFRSRVINTCKPIKLFIRTTFLNSVIWQPSSKWRSCRPSDGRQKRRKAVNVTHQEYSKSTDIFRVLDRKRTANF